MATNPSTRWFFNDWWLDIGLRACSVPARGLWIEILTLAATGPRRGYLVDADDKPIGVSELARLVGASKGSVSRWLAELEHHHVFSRDRDGIIFNRRMVREASHRSTGKRPKRPDPERADNQLELPEISEACRRCPARDSGFQPQNPPCSNPETEAAREDGEKPQEDPGARCARLADMQMPAASGPALARERCDASTSQTPPRDPGAVATARQPPARSPPCRKSPALAAKIKAQLAAKHVRYLGARGRPGEAAAYLAQIDETGIPPPEIFDATDRRMRRDGWDDMRTWCARHLTGPPAPGSLAALLARQGWTHDRRPAA